MTPYTWAEKFESFERINSIRETNGNFDSCYSCEWLVPSRLHELHESKFPFVSRIEFIRSKLSDFSAHVYGVGMCYSRPLGGPPSSSLRVCVSVATAQGGAHRMELGQQFRPGCGDGEESAWEGEIEAPRLHEKLNTKVDNNGSIPYTKHTKVLTDVTHVNSWVPSVDVSYTSPNFHLYRASNLSVLSFVSSWSCKRGWTVRGADRAADRAARCRWTGGERSSAEHQTLPIRPATVAEGDGTARCRNAGWWGSGVRGDGTARCRDAGDEVCGSEHPRWCHT